MDHQSKLLRTQDIVPSSGQFIKIWVDGVVVDAIPGESILSVLFAIGKRTITKNDHGKLTGAYCGMGVCHCCTVKVGNQHKVKACQTLVEAGIQIETQSNRLEQMGLPV